MASVDTGKTGECLESTSGLELCSVQEKDAITNGDSARSAPSRKKLVRSNKHVSVRVAKYISRKASSMMGSTIRETNDSSSHGTSKDNESTTDDGDESDDEETVDRRRIYRAVRDAGRFADGVSAVEVWVFDYDARKLVRPEGGWWRNPGFETTTETAAEALNQIEDEEREDYVAAEPLLPGTGLAGKLWAESSSPARHSSVAGQEYHSRRNFDADTLNRAGGDDETAGHSNAIQSPPVKDGKRISGGEGIEEGSEKIQSDFVEKNQAQASNNWSATKQHSCSPQRCHSSVSPPADQNHTLQSSTGCSSSRCDKPGQSQRCSSLPSLKGNNAVSSEEDNDATTSTRRRSSTILQHIMQRTDFRRFMMMHSQQSNESSRRNISARRILHLPHLHQPDKLLWRKLASLIADPDHPTFKRLMLLEQAGFSQAAGVPFETRGYEGVVVYLAKVDVEIVLSEPANETYLLHAADAIGAATALMIPRKKSVESKEERCKQWGVLRSSEDDPSEVNRCQSKLERTQATTSCLPSAINKMQRWRSKCKGGDLQPPPPMNTAQSALTFCGACITLLLLGWISELISAASGGQYHLILGPFGALMMLQYGLVMAPASQPRSAILGQCVSLTVALSFSYISEEIMPKYVRVALATSTAVSLMARLGVVHPPAAASAAVVSGGASGTQGWITIPLFLFGNAIAVVTATLINNVSHKRQYPTFWGLPAWVERVSTFISVKLKRPCCSKAWGKFYEDNKLRKEIDSGWNGGVNADLESHVENRV